MSAQAPGTTRLPERMAPRAGAERVPAADLFGLRPEAIVVYPGRRGEVLLLSDDTSACPGLPSSAYPLTHGRAGGKDPAGKTTSRSPARSCCDAVRKAPTNSP